MGGQNESVCGKSNESSSEQRGRNSWDSLGHLVSQLIQLATCQKADIDMTKTDMSKSFLYQLQLTESGVAKACTYVGDSYYFGEDGVKEDPQMASKWYMKAFQIAPERGCTNYDAAFCYENGFGVEKDCKEAFRLYRKAADLGRCYNVGCGVARDLASAIEWYEKALKARVRTRWTFLKLAALYYFDLHDYEKGFYWDLKAAEANSSIGQCKVAISTLPSNGTRSIFDKEKRKPIIRLNLLSLCATKRRPSTI